VAVRHSLALYREHRHGETISAPAIARKADRGQKKVPEGRETAPFLGTKGNGEETGGGIHGKKRV